MSVPAGPNGRCVPHAQPNRNASRCTISTYTGRRRRAAAGVRGGCAKFSSSAHPMTRLSSSPFGFPPRRVSNSMQLNAPPCPAVWSVAASSVRAGRRFWQRGARSRRGTQGWAWGLPAPRRSDFFLSLYSNPRRQRPVSRCHHVHQRPAAAQRQTVDISPRRMETVHMMLDGQMASDLAVSRSTQYGRSGVMLSSCPNPFNVFMGDQVSAHAQHTCTA